MRSPGVCDLDSLGALGVIVMAALAALVHANNCEDGQRACDKRKEEDSRHVARGAYTGKKGGDTGDDDEKYDTQQDGGRFFHFSVLLPFSLGDGIIY